jgi:hypothetical protein
MQAQMLQTLQ